MTDPMLEADVVDGQLVLREVRQKVHEREVLDELGRFDARHVTVTADACGRLFGGHYFRKVQQEYDVVEECRFCRYRRPASTF